MNTRKAQALCTRDFEFSLKAINENGQFSGYGSVFGVLDSYNEIVAPGAFSESLADYARKGRLPALLWQHRSAEPVGVYTSMVEDKIGLVVEGQLAMKTQRGAEAYELLKMNAISGLSIGFIPRKESRDNDTGITTLEVIDLWETSLVTFPANDAARVSEVKSLEEITDFKTAENYLRESGLSRRDAVAFIARAKSIFQSESDNAEWQNLESALSIYANPNR